MKALETVPKQFTLHARNPARDVVIGGEPVFAPAYGAPFLVDPEVGKRMPKMEDYHNLARLAQALPNQDLSGYLLVEPSDVPAKSAHLYMLHANMIHSDKPFLGSTEGSAGARQTMKMVEILFGEGLDKPVVLGLINPISPLGFSKEMSNALSVYAQAGQPVIIASLVMAGSTGPITLAGVLAQQNAELMAGIVLTQLINPGVPVIYGSTSTNIEMKSGALAIGSPELSMLVSAHAQLARFYKIPSRAGGALTDSSTPDAQAGFESMFSLLTTINSGVDFVLHSAGILSSYLAFSFEKFVLDDEMCGMIRHYRKGFRVDPETLAYDVIANVGHGGNFLMEMHTVERCRSEYWKPNLVDRRGLEAWVRSGRPDALTHANARWRRLLAEHTDPPLDETIKRQLDHYVEKQLSSE
jgi:trimethylamine--corrinoid protein Co-methyltransferase